MLRVGRGGRRDHDRAVGELAELVTLLSSWSVPGEFVSNNGTRVRNERLDDRLFEGECKIQV